ncbi:MAG: radical SAM protein [Candidatus Parvarchaeota archaeon]|nr:radical SAM protein [Candidatus Jingweiarchaeum tengchongense]MCW1298255.1 radical SAM protein [Candidatus Jingweiarchaeum tengchongense]MCW1300052.1 radical SAM protein [Candidatus Jingweiarchaeum tengchongense]MCW1304809.1 radical SAM protein [Candidatus Jingweiarchaeum tengchongense]MCW1305399.1 radical SAM protein [Candidatus Jingweiarchaeum tengchongense]
MIKNQKKLLFRMKIKSVVYSCTRACNLNCKHCYQDAGKKSKNELDTKRAINLIVEISELGGKQLLFSGGEPLLRKDIYNLIYEAKARGLEVELLSNGTLINDRVAQILSSLNVDGVQISIDGEKEFHDWLRGKSFDKAINAIKNLHDYHIQTEIAMVAMSKNYNQIENIADVAQSFGARFRVLRFLPLGRGAKNSYLSIDDKIYREIAERIKSKYNVTFAGIDTERCSAGIESIAIDPEGNVLPCELLIDYKMGNVREKSLKDILDDNRLKDFVREKSRKCKALECI